MGHLLPATPLGSLDEYLATDVGGLGLGRAVELGPAAVVDEVARAGLRGRGGGGFPTGRKWAGVRDQPGDRRYLVVNGAEGEPGTFKDRALLRANPYQVVEGAIIAAFAIGASEVFVGLKASFEAERAAVVRAVAEMQSAGICTDCRVTVVGGPGEYLFGEEKALLEVIEGKDPLPRLLPPYEHGLFAGGPQQGWEARRDVGGDVGARAQGANPTLVNNVETLANVPHILARGAGWFRREGTEASPGTVVCTVVGDVARDGVGEVAMGTPLAEVVDRVGGGARPGRVLRAVLPGVANAVLTAERFGVPLTYEDLAAAGSGLGAAGFIAVDDTACPLEVARKVSRFLHVESCGQCPPCKQGSGEITEALDRIEEGRGQLADVEAIQGWLVRVTDGSRCYLATQEQVVVASVLRAFAAEVAEHLVTGCRRRRRWQVPVLVDLVDGRAVLDPRQPRKQPDWTYAPGP